MSKTGSSDIYGLEEKMMNWISGINLSIIYLYFKIILTFNEPAVAPAVCKFNLERRQLINRQAINLPQFW